MRLWEQGLPGLQCFGAHKKQNAKSAPTRIIVRDAMLSEESKEMIKSLPLANRSYVERKVENIIKRDIGTADSPRTIERVPAGMSFDFEIILRIFEGDEEGKLLAFVKEGLEAVESSYLGGSGSRVPDKSDLTMILWAVKMQKMGSQFQGKRRDEFI